MTIAIPPRLHVTNVVANFASASSSCLDTAGTSHTVTVSFSGAVGSGALLFLGVTEGTGLHPLQNPKCADWRIPASMPHSSDSVAVSIPAGVTSYAIGLEINENLDASETYKLRIIGGNGIAAGTSVPLHTVTCTRGHTKPKITGSFGDAGYCGHNPSITNTVGSVVLTPSNPTLTNTIVTGDVKIKTGDWFIDNCWIKGGTNFALGVSGYSGPTNGKIYRSTIGGNGVLTDEGIYQTFDLEAELCHFYDLGADGMNQMRRSHIHDCFIEKLGMKQGSHADFFQSQLSGLLDALIEYCVVFMPYPGTPDYPGAPYKSNAVLQIDNADQQKCVLRKSWVVGGNHTFTYGDPSNNHSGHVLENLRIGVQNAGWANGLSAVIAALVNDPENGSLQLRSAGCKWDGGTPETNMGVANQPITGNPWINKDPVWS